MAAGRKRPTPADTAYEPRTIAPLGDTAVLVEFCEAIDLDINRYIQRLGSAMLARREPWIRDVIPAFTTLGLHLDPDHAGARDPVKATWALIDACVRAGLPDADAVGRLIEVPICYDDECGFEMDAIVNQTGLSRDDIIRRHAASAFRVLVVGFAPGHPYLGGLDPALSIPRRATPRASTPVGSVGIANEQCVVYPFELPGGWTIVGRTPLRFFDPRRPAPSIVLPGDAVRFVPIDRDEYERQRVLHWDPRTP